MRLITTVKTTTIIIIINPAAAPIITNRFMPVADVGVVDMPANACFVVNFKGKVPWSPGCLTRL